MKLLKYILLISFLLVSNFIRAVTFQDQSFQGESGITDIEWRFSSTESLPKLSPENLDNYYTNEYIISERTESSGGMLFAPPPGGGGWVKESTPVADSFWLFLLFAVVYGLKSFFNDKKKRLN